MSMDPNETLGVTTVYCPRCGGAMRIAPQHMRMTVACPGCDHNLQPSRLVGGQGAAPPPPPGGAVYRGDVSERNRWIAGTLGVLLGSLGVHRFYLGFTGIGVIQLILCFVTFGISGIWGFIEGILCFCGAMRDVEGRRLSG